nr:hypothetical protein [[Ruminococcus] lactaris]
MHTLKKFIHYYQPYKLVFFIDLICAAIISLVDLAYPQILTNHDKDFIYQRVPTVILHALPWIASGLAPDVPDPESGCKYYVSYQGHMMGAIHGTGYAPTACLTIMRSLSFSYYESEQLRSDDEQTGQSDLFRHLGVCPSWS